MGTKTFSVAISPEEDSLLFEWLNEQPTKQKAILTALRYYHANVISSGKTKQGFLYVLFNQATGAARIGFTRQPNRIIKPLSSMAGTKLKLLYAFPIAKAEIVDLVKEYLDWHGQHLIGSWYHWTEASETVIEDLQGGISEDQMRDYLILETYD